MTQKTKWLDLLINGDTRQAEVAKGNDQYVVMVPAANLVDASGSGQNTPTVQGHRAVFDRNGVLLGVDALGWNAEGGFYNTKWPSKVDSIYNANAAKTYAPQVFQQMKKDGGWLTKFQNGGSTQPTQEQVMKELMTIVQQAATELQSNKPGQGVQTLAQIANDPQGSQLLDVLVQQIPEAGQIVEAVMKMVGAFKCGGKTKKKVKKGAKGCVPCKKLMRVGGKLINIWSDCEGNIIKHATGGWIRKGQIGLNTAGIVKDQFKQDKLSADNVANLQDRYFLKNDGTLGYQTWDASAKSWKDGVFNIDNFNTWNKDNNMFADGFVYDHTTNMGHFNGDEIKARAAMGQAYDNQEYIVSGNTVNGVTGASGHKALGTLGKDPTRRDALNQPGGLAKEINASLQQEADDLATVKNDWKTKRSTIWANGLQKGDLAALRESRQIRKDQSRGIKQAANADRLAWITEANKMASEKLGKQPEVTTPTVTPTKAKKVSVKTSLGDGTYTPRFAKQGGWLTKFN